MRKLNLRALQRQPGVRAQARERPQPLQPVERRALAQQQVLPARRELLRERYQPLVRPSRVQAWLVWSVRL